MTNIIIGIKEYNGKVGIDIREFVESERYTGPTKKGLRIPAESFREFKEMINSISEDDLKEVPKTEEDKKETDNESLSSHTRKKETSKKREQKTFDEEVPDY